MRAQCTWCWPEQHEARWASVVGMGADGGNYQTLNVNGAYMPVETCEVAHNVVCVVCSVTVGVVSLFPEQGITSVSGVEPNSSGSGHTAGMVACSPVGLVCVTSPGLVCVTSPALLPGVCHQRLVYVTGRLLKSGVCVTSLSLVCHQLMSWHVRPDLV